MEQSILISTKAILGVNEDDTDFDLDIITHINSAFATLNQIGVGDQTIFSISSASDVWLDFDVPADQLALVKSCLFLKVRMIFDPPSTSFHLDTINKQIEQFEWRLSVMREGVKYG